MVAGKIIKKEESKFHFKRKIEIEIEIHDLDAYNELIREFEEGSLFSTEYSNVAYDIIETLKELIMKK